MLFRSKNKKKTDSRIILGMIMLEDNSPFNLRLFLDDIKGTREYKVGKPSGDENAVTLAIDREMVAIGSMPMAIPMGDIEGAAKYAYNWENALEVVKEHKAHLIVTIMQGSDDMVKRYKIFTSVICSLLLTNKAIGVYMGNQTLLIPKDDYLRLAARMSEKWYPLNLWIYFGFGRDNDKNSGYTYGLKEFNKRELEIVDSAQKLEDIMAFLFNMTHYVLDYNVEFQDGQTCGLSESERIGITLSKGVFVDGETFKMAY
jgi:hypothetical protein